MSWRLSKYSSSGGGVVVLDVEVEVVLVTGARVVVGGLVVGAVVVVLAAGAAVVVLDAVVPRVVDGPAALVDGAGSTLVVELAGDSVTRLPAADWSGAGRSLTRLPTSPTAAVASRIEATVATIQASTDAIFRLMTPSWRIRRV